MRLCNYTANKTTYCEQIMRPISLECIWTFESMTCGALLLTRKHKSRFGSATFCHLVTTCPLVRMFTCPPVHLSATDAQQIMCKLTTTFHVRTSDIKFVTIKWLRVQASILHVEISYIKLLSIKWLTCVHKSLYPTLLSVNRLLSSLIEVNSLLTWP